MIMMKVILISTWGREIIITCDSAPVEIVGSRVLSVIYIDTTYELSSVPTWNMEIQGDIYKEHSFFIEIEMYFPKVSFLINTRDEQVMLDVLPPSCSFWSVGCSQSKLNYYKNVLQFT